MIGLGLLMYWGFFCSFVFVLGFVCVCLFGFITNRKFD